MHLVDQPVDHDDLPLDQDTIIKFVTVLAEVEAIKPKTRFEYGKDEEIGVVSSFLINSR